MASFLDKNWDEKQQKYIERGMYDPLARYGFYNIIIEKHPVRGDIFYSRNKDFTFTWNGSPINVKAGSEIELPEHLAILATHKLVDEIMTDIAHEDTIKLREKSGDFTIKSPFGAALGIPAARKVWEDKIIRKLKIDEQSPQIQILKAQIKDQILTDITNSQKSAAPIESVAGSLAQSVAEFSDIKK